MRMFGGKATEPFTQAVTELPQRGKKLSVAAAETVRGIEDLMGKVELLTEDRQQLERDNDRLIAELRATKQALERVEHERNFYQNAYVSIVTEFNTVGGVIDAALHKARDAAKKMEPTPAARANEAPALHAVEQELADTAHDPA